MLPWHQYLLGFIFFIAGFFHFQKPKLYRKIMPPYIPAHSTMILATGAMEMIFGLMLLNPETQVLAAWLLLALLVLFLPVHVHMLRNEEASLKLPKWILILRIPLQFALMYWVYQYTLG